MNVSTQTTAAPARGNGAPFDLSGLTTWAAHNVLGIIALVVAAFVMIQAKKGDMSAALTAAAILILGAAIASLALSGGYLSVGDWVASWVA